ncbi:hypothetical protein RHGRI_023931 [Rhododendron griersonianum]|uniref:G patch domain-containing protein n=1 Tax=Rhododendron griersonianum TaxID=479676 RepID=A0AAV6J9I2_9ERIC|nr:hypothetical protein RHGRI_023931 [Rhododendron griersonianum]
MAISANNSHFLGVELLLVPFAPVAYALTVRSPLSQRKPLFDISIFNRRIRVLPNNTHSTIVTTLSWISNPNSNNHIRSLNMDSDEEDFVFYGTPIEREEEVTSRKKKAVAEASGLLRTLPPWKQEVTDEEGRRRFHGAFTGGYSAGYYNTVGSKEGWIPQTFTSSRKNRAEIKQQSILNFLDDDEKGVDYGFVGFKEAEEFNDISNYIPACDHEEMEGHSLGTSMKFDTFGFTAAEIARKQAEKEQQQRPSIIPGPAPDELVLPATDSIGVKLLLKMGWRHGHAIKDSRTNSLYDARREARKAFLALSSDDTAAQRTGSEDVKGDLGNIVELPMDNDHQSSHSTPVGRLPSCWLYT